jgi:hypothetical protein
MKTVHLLSHIAASESTTWLLSGYLKNPFTMEALFANPYDTEPCIRPDAGVEAIRIFIKTFRCKAGELIGFWGGRISDTTGPGRRERKQNNSY